MCIAATEQQLMEPVGQSFGNNFNWNVVIYDVDNSPSSNHFIVIIAKITF